jgi:hypothetical protein
MAHVCEHCSSRSSVQLKEMDTVMFCGDGQLYFSKLPYYKCNKCRMSAWSELVELFCTKPGILRPVFEKYGEYGPHGKPWELEDYLEILNRM